MHHRLPIVKPYVKWVGGILTNKTRLVSSISWFRGIHNIENKFKLNTGEVCHTSLGLKYC